MSDGEKNKSDKEDSSEKTTDSTSALLDVDINNSAPELATEDQLKRSKKQRRGKVDAFEEVVLKKVTDDLRDTDKMFLELEEKRMEYEAQQKRKERQFQLQFAQMHVEQPSGPPH